LLRAVSSVALKTAGDRDSTASPGKLFCCLNSIIVLSVIVKKKAWAREIIWSSLKYSYQARGDSTRYEELMCPTAGEGQNRRNTPANRSSLSDIGRQIWNFI